MTLWCQLFVTCPHRAGTVNNHNQNQSVTVQSDPRTPVIEKLAREMIDARLHSPVSGVSDGTCSGGSENRLLGSESRCSKDSRFIGRLMIAREDASYSKSTTSENSWRFLRPGAHSRDTRAGDGRHNPHRCGHTSRLEWPSLALFSSIGDTWRRWYRSQPSSSPLWLVESSIETPSFSPLFASQADHRFSSRVHFSRLLTASRMAPSALRGHQPGRRRDRGRNQ